MSLRELFEAWKAQYVHAYRKAHRAFYEGLHKLETEIASMRPQVRALVKMNSITELGPPLIATLSAAEDLAAIDRV
jgi:hypothetical protein